MVPLHSVHRASEALTARSSPPTEGTEHAAVVIVDHSFAPLPDVLPGQRLRS